MDPSTTQTLAVIATVLAGLLAIERMAQAILARVAPMTKTTLDDTAAAKLNSFIATQEKWFAWLQGLVTPTPTVPPTTIVTGTAPASTTTVTTTTAPGTPSAKAAQAGRARMSVVTMLAAITVSLAVAAAACSMSCVSSAEIKAAPGAAATALIDCAKADQAAIATVLAELGSDALSTALGSGSVNWDAMLADAFTQGKVIGGCAAAEFVAALSKSTAAAPAAGTTAHALVASSPAAAGQAMLERLRTAYGGGVSWSTEGK